MYILVSVPNEAFHRVMRARALQRKLGVETSVYRNASDLRRSVETSFGGRLVLLDWTEGKVVADIGVPGASGVAVGDGVIYASSWTENSVRILRRGHPHTCLSHSSFNHLHTVELTDNQTLLIASAGADVIVELSSSRELLWHWYGPEHGFRRHDSVAERFDPSADYRGIRTSTSERAMHVTCALPVGDDCVLASLFHQGQVIAIDRCSGVARVLLDGLVRPHGIHRYADGFIVSDTLGHRILFLDESLQLSSEIPFGRQWLQDTIPISRGTFLSLENVHIDQVPESGLSNRIVELNSDGQCLRQLRIPADHRLFTAREVDDATADWIARDWGLSGEQNAWIWD